MEELGGMETRRRGELTARMAQNQAPGVSRRALAEVTKFEGEVTMQAGNRSRSIGASRCIHSATGKERDGTASADLVRRRPIR
jgi:hypothetical protein